ncbi:hypothetical protein LPY66_18360 [Dehalobacter sp. DCM]|uniref:hypothetical protein n=1 Tax=Dehalobacter sp. DCM TaxID=2907827 RepID=UPI003081261F|nr:hypothetical protein LPY66_18360 [Dehalobacter sp. DCM]
MDNFTQEDHDWWKRIQETPEKYKVVIDNDCVWVDLAEEDQECVYTFSTFGNYFIHALLIDMGINVGCC